MEIKYDTPIEVSEKAYHIFRTQFAGIVAHREENKKYFIKVWLMEYKGAIANVLKTFPCGKEI